MKQKIDVTIVEDVLSKEQVCAILNIKERTLEDLLRSGKLVGRKVNARWVILKSDLIAYVKSH